MPGFLKPRTCPTSSPEKIRDTYIRIIERAGTLENAMEGIRDRIKKLDKRVVDEVKEAGGIILDTYGVLDEQYSGKLQPLRRFIGNSLISFILVDLLFVVLLVALFMASAFFKFVVYSILMGVGMALWYGTFEREAGALVSGFLGLVVCLVFAEELMAFLYHLHKTEKTSDWANRVRAKISGMFIPYLKLTGRWGFIAAMASFTFSSCMLGPIMAYFFNMRRREARIAVFTGFTLQAIFWTSIYVFVIPVFTHPLLITIIVFGCTFLIISMPGIIDGFKRRSVAS